MKGKNQFITIAGGHFSWVISDLASQMIRCKRPPEASDRPGSHEVDFSIVICLLLVLMFESYLARVRHFDKTSTAESKRYPSKYFSTLKGCKRLSKRVEEIMLLRNSIAHNHVFEYEQLWNWEKIPTKYRNFQIDTSWQVESNKAVYSKHVALKKFTEPRTKILKLRVAPTFIGREEVLTVLETIHAALTALHKYKYLDISLEHKHVPFKKEGNSTKSMVVFWDLEQEIRESINLLHKR